MSQQKFTEYKHIIHRTWRQFHYFVDLLILCLMIKDQDTHLFPLNIFLKNDEIILEYFQELDKA